MHEQVIKLDENVPVIINNSLTMHKSGHLIYLMVQVPIYITEIQSVSEMPERLCG